MDDSCPSRLSLERAYREWLLDQAAAEAAKHCPRLSQLKSRVASHFFAVTHGWSTEQQRQLMQARIKSARYLSLVEEPLTAAEQALAAEFSWPILHWSTPGRPQVTIDYPWSPGTSVDANKEEAALLDLRAAAGHFSVTKGALKKEVRKALKPMHGSPLEANGEFRYWLPLSRVTLETVVWFTPGSLAQWSYWHRLLPGRVDKTNQVRPGEELLLRSSITDLLGVHVTQWDCMTDADIPSQVHLLAAAVSGFIEAAPSIVEAAVHHDAGVL